MSRFYSHNIMVAADMTTDLWPRHILILPLHRNQCSRHTDQWLRCGWSASKSADPVRPDQHWQHSLLAISSPLPLDEEEAQHGPQSWELMYQREQSFSIYMMHPLLKDNQLSKCKLYASCWSLYHCIRVIVLFGRSKSEDSTTLRCLTDALKDTFNNNF